jgi:hypothetical protein
MWGVGHKLLVKFLSKNSATVSGSERTAATLCIDYPPFVDYYLIRYLSNISLLLNTTTHNFEVSMFYQPPDLTAMILNEQIKDRERALQDARKPKEPERRLAYRFGSLLIRFGSRLQQRSFASDFVQEPAWPDQR